MIFCSLGDAFVVLSCQFWNTVLQCGCFLAGGVINCNLSHRRSVAMLCMLYKIRCNPVHPLNGALPGPYVPARVTRGALVAHRCIYAQPRCRTLQYSRTFIPFSVSLWNDLASSVLWPSTCALCASQGYTRYFDRTSVYLCASLLQNLAVPQDFYSLSVSLWNDLVDPVFDGVGLAGFKSRPMPFCWSSCSLLSCLQLYFLFLLFSSIG